MRHLTLLVGTPELRYVHADDAETTNDFGRVRDLLAAKEELGRIFVPVLVEASETLGREADGGGGCEVEVARVEEVEEGVLKNLSPHLEVFEVCAAGLFGGIS